MKTRIWYCSFGVAVLITVVFCMRQRTLSELRTGNQSLRQQLDAQAPTPTAEPTPAVQPTNPVVALSPNERTELLKLRGQILPLRRELQEMSNAVMILAQPAIPRASTQANRLSPPEPSDRQTAIQMINAFMRSEPYRQARNLNTALGDYLKSHSGELPDDLAKVATSARSPLAQGVSERFELMRSGRIPEAALSYTLVAREKEPQQLTDGRWMRIYLRADGGTTTAGPVAKPDWKRWEHENEAFMKQQGARNTTKSQAR